MTHPDPVTVSVTDDWLVDHATETGDFPVYLLLQGYPTTCFASIEEGTGITLPPKSPVSSVDWDYFWDVRMFGSQGEWHAWRHEPGRWQARALLTADLSDPVPRDQVLWGARVEVHVDGWTCCSEANGVRLWLPFHVEKHQLPVLLRTYHVVGCEEDTGVAGFVDAMLTGFSWAGRAEG